MFNVGLKNVIVSGEDLFCCHCRLLVSCVYLSTESSRTAVGGIMVVVVVMVLGRMWRFGCVSGEWLVFFYCCSSRFVHMMAGIGLCFAHKLALDRMCGSEDSIMSGALCVK